jgi:ABC-type uncharacterized transport system involved in gliding motility auxiliary subunit
MKPEWRRFAPIGLYLALLAALVAISLYIIQREWNLYLQISLGLVLVGLAIFALLDPERVRAALTGRQARYGSNTLVMSLAFIGVLVVVNYLGFKNTIRKDLTADKQNTLAPETLDTLNKLPQPVEALAFYSQRVASQSDSAKKLLEQYKFEGKGKFSYRIIDPEADPLAARDAKITRDGMVVVKMGDRQEPVEFVDEKDMTSALVRLIGNETRAVYFLTGHGERDPEGTGNDAYSSAKQVLESKNYKVGKLNLLSTNNIPDDAKVIIVAGPQQPLASDEVDKLKAFSEAGGALMVMEEPVQTTDFGDKPDPMAEYLNQVWGITLGNDMVIDLTLQQAYVAVANSYASHPITSKMQGLAALFPTARSVKATGNISGITSTEIVLTSDQAWGETDLESTGGSGQVSVAPDPGKDTLGPVPLVTVAQSTDRNNRVAVFGDADFATDANFTQLGNGDLLINTIDWAAGQENLINLTPKDSVQRILVPPTRYTLGLILFGSIFVVPGAVLVAGVIVWIQRRKRG